MKNDSPPQSLVDQVSESILSMLNDRLSLTPERLSVSSIAADLGVSRTPVTMALFYLASAGLIRRNADGWYTSPLRVEDIQEIFEIKEALGPLFMAKAAERITPEVASKLLRQVQAMEEAAEQNDVNRWLKADEAYHGLLFETIGNSRYQALQNQLNSQIYKLRAGQMVMGERMLASTCEHRAMAEAVVANDPDTAARLTVEHVRRLKASLLNLVQDVLIPMWGRELGLRRSNPHASVPTDTRGTCLD